MDWKKDERSASACKISISASEFCWGQVCIASRGKVKKLCMEVKAGTSADGYIRALRGSGGLKSQSCREFRRAPTVSRTGSQTSCLSPYQYFVVDGWGDFCVRCVW
jgi:hypothetical protein